MILTTLCAAVVAFGPQESGDAAEYRLELSPEVLTLEVGESSMLEARLTDTAGESVGGADLRILYYTRDKDAISVKSDGTVTAHLPGTWQVFGRGITPAERNPSDTVTVRVSFPELDHIEFEDAPAALHAGTTRRVRARLVDEKGLDRGSVPFVATETCAQVDAFGHVTGVTPGRCELVAEAEGFRAVSQLEVLANPIRDISLFASHGARAVRTGDVVTFTAVGLDEAGEVCTGVPIHFAFEARPEDDLAPAATGQIEQNGRFVAEAPGMYTIVASSGAVTAHTYLEVTLRDVQRRIELVGQGHVRDVHTSDLWVWEGVDGRDYCVTGTWGGNGDAIFWDVTDPAAILKIATVTVDARTVNDVKVNEAGTLCVISREGASNRKNGIVIIDVKDPRNPEILSTYTENLTGGVHNVFIYEEHVYALSAGRWYAIINIEDPLHPHQVGSFELEEPDHSIHDVWVEAGVAYSSNWSHGVQVVDVGGGGLGGSPENPVRMGSYAYPSGWNHAAFPYRNAETGKFYVIAGDEAFPYGLHVEDSPTYPRGWLHFIDFTDMQNPKEVARFEVPEAGTHNLWVEGDLLYTAYYNGGLRVVDVSGDLMGDLYRQGREVASFLPTDPEGKIANAPMVWGPQPHKEHLFFSDWNSGLWAMKLIPEAEQ